MFEYHGWAVLRSDEGTDEADDALMEELRARIKELPEATRASFHVGGAVNGLRTVSASGLRNHSRAEVVEVFRWLAERSPRSYGLLYVNDDAVEEGDRDAFRVHRLRWGRLEVFDDPFLS
jgi:hypothetical protein